MLDDATRLGQAYLQHLGENDLRLLALGAPDPDRGASAPDRIRADAAGVEALLARSTVADVVLSTRPEIGEGVPPSPFLVFASAVHQTARQLAAATFVSEWFGPRHRAPVFDVAGLREFLADGWRRLFLAELLSSYTRVASGSVVVSTRRGLRRRRFSELDPVRLAELLEVVPDAERPGIFRRLGDLALFLTGVFPDHTALAGLTPADESRLLRVGRVRRGSERTTSTTVPGFGDAGAVALLEMLGRRWYDLAHDFLPGPPIGTMRVVAELPDRFGDARRILNVLTERHLFPFRSEWFGIGR